MFSDAASTHGAPEFAVTKQNLAFLDHLLLGTFPSHGLLIVEQERQVLAIEGADP